MSENTHEDNQPQPKGRKATKGNGPIPPVMPVKPVEPEAPDFLPHSPARAKQIAFEPDDGVGGPQPTAKSVFENLEDLRVTDDELGDEEDLSGPSVMFNKPKRTKYFRTHPDWSLNALLFEYEDEEKNRRVTYYVHPSLKNHPALEGCLKRVTLYAYIYLDGQLGIWAVSRAAENGPQAGGYHWSKSAKQAVKAAQTTWIRVYSTSGRYKFAKPKGVVHPDPIWPSITFNEMLADALEDLCILNDKHEIIIEMETGEQPAGSRQFD